MTCGTYTITNRINKKWYAGQSVDIEARWKGHIRNAAKGSSGHLYSAIRKYGVDNFEFRIVEECPRNKDDLNKCEQKLLDMRPDYNESFIAGAIEMTLEVIKKIIFKNTGRKRSQEAKDRMSRSQLGNTNMLGKHHTEETKKKNSQSHLGKPSWWKGRKNTPEETVSQSLRQTGKSWSDKRRAAYEQNGTSEETREKLRISTTRTWSTRKKEQV